MKRLVTDVLNMEDFDEKKMDELLDKAVILSNRITFFFKDGHTVEREYKEQRPGFYHEKAYRSYMSDIMKVAKSNDPYKHEKIQALKEEWRREDNRWQKQ